MKKLIPTIISTFLVFVIASCSNSNTLDTKPIICFLKPSKQAKLIESNNDFAFSFFKEIALNDDENYMVSPVSLSLALGMLYNGAETKTKNIMETVLGYSDFTSLELSQINNEIINTLEGEDLQIANSNWIREGFVVKNNFIELNQIYYDAEIKTEDFSNPNTLNLINDWVSNKTNEKIPEIINEISSDAVLYLINAIYFNANWKYEFNSENTNQSLFYTDANSSKEVTMMQIQSDKLAYLDNDLFSSVILPYKDDKYSMTLLVPTRNKNVSDIIDILDGTTWNTWQNNYKIQNLTLSLPKFKFEYENTLNNELTNLGLGNLFENPDLSGIANEELTVSKVLQKTFIDVNEKGTEAAAVTTVEIETTSTIPTSYVNCNKPFLFAITEKETGIICFIGKISNPNY